VIILKTKECGLAYLVNFIFVILWHFGIHFKNVSILLFFFKFVNFGFSVCAVNSTCANGLVYSVAVSLTARPGFYHDGPSKRASL